MAMTSPLGLRTSGRQLREMLSKSGVRHNTVGVEKLDFLVWIADQVKASIEEKRRMHLTIVELSDFLRLEQLDNFRLDAKGAVSGLLALRRRELARLSYGSDRTREIEATDACFEMALLDMPVQEVAGCFGDPWREEVGTNMDVEPTENSMVPNSPQVFCIGDDDDAEEEFFSSMFTSPSGAAQMRLAREAAEAAQKTEEESLAREAVEAAQKAEKERLAREAAEAAQKAEEERLAREAAEAAQKAEEERLARKSFFKTEEEVASAAMTCSQREYLMNVSDELRQKLDSQFQKAGKAEEAFAVTTGTCTLPERLTGVDDELSEELRRKLDIQLQKVEGIALPRLARAEFERMD